MTSAADGVDRAKSLQVKLRRSGAKLRIHWVGQLASALALNHELQQIAWSAMRSHRPPVLLTPT